MDLARGRRRVQKWGGLGNVRSLALIPSPLAEPRSLGGSGSGKTTLLNAVAHRLGGLPIEDGEVAYFASTEESGRDKLARGEVKRRIGFVRQQDFLVECLTGKLIDLRTTL